MLFRSKKPAFSISIARGALESIFDECDRFDVDETGGASTLQAAWKARHGTRAAPLLVVAIHEGRASICGPSGEYLPIHFDKDLGTIERLCLSSLKQPDRHAALIFLAEALPSLDVGARTTQ